jgi:hypothetical protein
VIGCFSGTDSANGLSTHFPAGDPASGINLAYIVQGSLKKIVKECVSKQKDVNRILNLAGEP